MIKLIRSNQKKFLAGLTIFSMVGFLVNRGNGTREGNADRNYATIDGKTIKLSELAQARAEVSAMRANLQLEGVFPEWVMQPVYQPELFMLLRHEADEAGVRANPDEVNTILVNLKKPEADPENDDAAKAGVADLLKIIGNFSRVSAAVKVTQPEIDKELAEQEQSLQAKLVQLRADQLLNKVPAPTTQQAQEQFNKFADTLPGRPVPTTNPFGFGYKQPDRASFEYLRLSDDAVTAGVVASKTPFDWEVAAYKYYDKNKDQYRQPGPTTNPSSISYTPEQQVEGQILSILRKDLISDLRRKIETYIATTMDADWATYSQFIAAGSHGTEPDSSLGVPYSSNKYLLKMYDSVHAKFNVNLVADNSPGFLPQKQYTLLYSPAVADFVTRQMSDYLAKFAAGDPAAIAIMHKPSDPLPDILPTATLFVRLTGVLKAAPPPDMASIRTIVDNDLKLTKAYEIAKDQAAALLLADRSDTLDTVAKALGQTIIPPDPKAPIRFNSNSEDLKSIVPPLGDNAPSFCKQAFKLLDNYDPAEAAHPAVIIELPESGRVFVAQLVSVQAKWNRDEFLTDYQKAASTVHQNLDGTAQKEWFNLDKAKARLKFQLLKGN